MIFNIFRSSPAPADQGASGDLPDQKQLQAELEESITAQPQMVQTRRQALELSSGESATVDTLRKRQRNEKEPNDEAQESTKKRRKVKTGKSNVQPDFEVAINVSKPVRDIKSSNTAFLPLRTRDGDNDRNRPKDPILDEDLGLGIENKQLYRAEDAIPIEESTAYQQRQEDIVPNSNLPEKSSSLIAERSTKIPGLTSFPLKVGGGTSNNSEMIKGNRPTIAKGTTSNSKVGRQDQLKTQNGHLIAASTENKLATHIRFGSEEPGPNTVEQDSAPQSSGNKSTERSSVDGSIESEEEEEEEEPEVLTLSSGLALAKSAQAGAVEAVERQQGLARQKRIGAAQRLNSQVKVSKLKTHQHKKHGSKLDESNNTAQPDERSMVQHITSVSQRISLSELPNLLPPEVLAFEPVATEDTILESSRTNSQEKRHQFFTDTKPTKVVKKGSVFVKVLEKSNDRLAPKADKNSKALKDLWLTGRTDARGKPCVPRRKPRGGFLRK